MIWYRAKTRNSFLKPQEIEGTMEIPDFADRIAEVKHVKLAVRDKHNWNYYVTEYGEVKRGRRLGVLTD